MQPPEVSSAADLALASVQAESSNLYQLQEKDSMIQLLELNIIQITKAFCNFTFNI